VRAADSGAGAGSIAANLPRMATAARRSGAIEDLAVFTGRPTFPSPLHVGAPTIGDPDAFLAAAREILDRRWLSNDGPTVREFERRVAERTQVEHCVAFCNGTAALEVLARASGLSGEVIVPSFTFVATAHAFMWLGLTPVFCEIDARTHNLDPRHVRELVTDRASAIVGVHLWGRPAYSDELEELALERGLKLFYDAAHAIGSSYGGSPVGGRGDAEVLSFHATKIVNAFEGGAVLTNDGELARKLRLMRNFGFVGYDDVRSVGVNAKLPEMSAAMGINTLAALDETIEINRRNYEAYRTGLEDVVGVSLLRYDDRERNNYQYVVLELDPRTPTMPRDDLIRILHAENVLARRYFYPGCHRMEPYSSLRPDLRLPVTEDVAARIVVLPTGPAVSLEDVASICRIIQTAIANFAVLPRLLPSFQSARPPA
jgi:dTDP-4-amino-4,6-dideoxygalactose transaminase